MIGSFLNAIISSFFEGLGYIRLMMLMVYSTGILFLITILVIVYNINRIISNARYALELLRGRLRNENVNQNAIEQ
jgi:hypothetical protein